MRKLALLLALGLVAFASPAVAWEIGAMNKTINQTNFILDNVCSATLVSLKHKAILTNYHCVDDKITVEDRDEAQPDGTVKKVRRHKMDDVTLSQKSYQGAAQVGEASYIAEIVAHSKRSDLALLRIKADSIPHTVASPLASDSIQRGERVYIVGNPRMLDASVVEGLISSVTRTFEVQWAEGAKVPFYQVSGGLTGGNSGGALYNDRGELIGVPAAGFAQEHLGLAIQLPAIKAFLKDSCFEAVYDEAAEDPAACLEAKKKAAKESAPKF